MRLRALETGIRVDLLSLKFFDFGVDVWIFRDFGVLMTQPKGVRQATGPSFSTATTFFGGVE